MTLESDVYGRQILMSKVDLRTERVNIYNIIYNGRRPITEVFK